ncbi:MAG: hypothetical protein K2K97_11690 [Muribaculaceae bacterium]|nr:hypothetical protein [Muribaculaceae bacterium]
MAQITTLKDKDGTTLYPITSSKAVFDENGIDLDTRLAGKVSVEHGKQLSTNDYTDQDKNKLDQLPTKEQLNVKFAEKQPQLVNSPDITVHPDNQLSITDLAKRALFDDMWREAGGTVIIPGTTYSLNGVNGITYNEALSIYRTTASFPIINGSTGDAMGLQNRLTLKTAFPFNIGYTVSLRGFNPHVEVVCFNNPYADGAHVTNMRQTFINTKRVLTPLVVNAINTSATEGFYSFGNPKLEYILIAKLTINLPLGEMPKIELECFQYMITKAANTTPITITVHPDVYAKLTGDTTNVAYNNLTDEEKQQWTALIEQAAAKNIQFATA